jgi:iron-sulfur cluster assembly protein
MRQRLADHFLYDEQWKGGHIMLVLTTAAVEVVKAVTAVPEAPEGAGLRIAAASGESPNTGALQVTAVASPGEHDQVLEGDGARVFLEPQAAAYLDDKVLDAQMDEQGRAHFTLGDQGGDQGGEKA